MDYDRILRETKSLIKDIKNFKNKKDFKKCNVIEFETKMDEKYIYLKASTPMIYSNCINESVPFDTLNNILSCMIQQAKDLQKNKITNHEAEVKIGEKLVDVYVKPLVEKEKKRKEEEEKNNLK